MIEVGFVFCVKIHAEFFVWGGVDGERAGEVTFYVEGQVDFQIDCIFIFSLLPSKNRVKSSPCG